MLLFSYGLRDVPVDTHVGRVAGRLHLLRHGAASEELHDAMTALTPPGAELELHINLLRHGRRTCHAQRPALPRVRAAADVPRAACADVLLATCAQLPEGDADERLLPPALAAHGLEARFAVWDDSSADWDSARLVVVRSTWDYTGRLDAFLRWAESVPRLRNPAEVLRWNTDKRYLDDLADAGLPVVPTAFVTPGGPRPPLHGDVVVKPAVSAGARDTARFDAGAPPRGPRPPQRAPAATGARRCSSPTRRRSTSAARRRCSTSAASTRTRSARARSSPGAAARRACASTRAACSPPRRSAAYEPTRAERAAGDAVVAAPRASASAPRCSTRGSTSSPTTTASPRVLELELTEPSLFLGYARGAPERLAAAIAAIAAPV